MVGVVYGESDYRDVVVVVVYGESDYRDVVVVVVYGLIHQEYDHYHDQSAEVVEWSSYGRIRRLHGQSRVV